MSTKSQLDKERFASKSIYLKLKFGMSFLNNNFRKTFDQFNTVMSLWLPAQPDQELQIQR